MRDFSGQSSKSLGFKSVHTASFAAILKQLNISLVVSTYQAGKLIVLRSDGEVVNTHFRMFNKPMGVAATQGRLAIGTKCQIWELRNVATLAGKLEPKGKHDACYLPRNCHITGDIDIHEMAWGNEELWFINTRFSCLCTLDFIHSFIPRWRPRFISQLSPEDRCHLNGLAMINQRPQYVTALGTTDTQGGWREEKATGGVVIDIDSQEIVAPELSMPHSPRWYNEQLWCLESGQGSLITIEPKSGQRQTIAQMPGFTRGLDFWKGLAFVGLSQIRETTVFGSIPLTQRLQERTCGIWVINITNGETVAFLRFEGAVQEIFSVQVLPGIRFPEIIDWDDQLISQSYILPDDALAEVPENLLNNKTS